VNSDYCNILTGVRHRCVLYLYMFLFNVRDLIFIPLLECVLDVTLGKDAKSTVLC